MKSTKYAQTNIQFYNELIEQRVPESELSSVISVYEYAIELFAYRFRSSGKPFLSHLVGTASITFSISHDLELSKAAMLHAALSLGKFSTKISGEKQKEIEERVGKYIGHLVYGYFKLRWYPDSVRYYVNYFSSLPKIIKPILLLRLTNELEDYLDYGMSYSSNKRFKMHQSNWNDLCELARLLGYPSLALELDFWFKKTEEMDGKNYINTEKFKMNSFLA